MAQYLNSGNMQERMMGQYTIGRTLGSGMSGKVKLAKNNTTGEVVALKLIQRSTLNERSRQNLVNEINAMKAVNHPNVLNLKDVEEDAQYPKKNGTNKQVVMLVLEIASNGELFDYLMHTGPFSEAVARTYFSQMISALEECHRQGIAHRDIKPENLFLDDSFQLKVADFGLSAMTDHLLKTECGTRSYMAPEILGNQRYDGKKADIWSAGVVLFIMMTGHPPFQIALPQDWWFNEIQHRRHERFWQAHLRTTPNFPPEAQSFLNTIFTASPDDRTTIEGMKSHPWMSGPILTGSELQQEMVDRKHRVDGEKERERAAARAKKAQQPHRGNRRRVDPFASNTHRAIAPPLLPAHMDQTAAVFYSSEAPDALLERLEGACQQMEGRVLKQKPEKFKLKVAFGNTVQATLQVFRTNPDEEADDIVAFALEKKMGDVLDFQKIQKGLMEKVHDVLGGSTEGEGAGAGEGADVPKPEGNQEEVLGDDVELI
uniref:non-specific serine/threonine protein kinase n=1 Tax=Fibrocapsa japonica TaxID=94617 RepID=A0A7S2UW55_9STRA|eukprot:CAMPEP_0113935240 /NCGR_PEP_ID=MMETSP1339-20121228/2420_1 /TAXON_ID=94617 /ORGANISM="Fibrocapsa japonica" /LENGTH=486 /DNA_ID=CAMNT_0000937311 /DNA_START=29 /DNA_END=1489 /DNA_ORIENTATION=- /assembly_acc=CAM_ASM_000762